MLLAHPEVMERPVVFVGDSAVIARPSERVLELLAEWRAGSRSNSEVPELAARARKIFDAYKHKTLATLRADGSPRVSGIEAEFWNGDVWLGSMPGSRKGADLKRDPRFALHSATVDPELDRRRREAGGPRRARRPRDEFTAYVQRLQETRRARCPKATSTSSRSTSRSSS